MAETINMPKLGFDMAEGTLVRWVKKVGETVKKGDVLAEIETDKATVEVESSASGVIRKLLVDEGAVVPVSMPIAIVGTADEKLEEVAAPVSTPIANVATTDIKLEEVAAPADQSSTVESQPAIIPEPTPAPVVSTMAPSEGGPVKASPLAKKIARDRNVDLSQVRGSGPGGRIVRRDIELALAS